MGRKENTHTNTKNPNMLWFLFSAVILIAGIYQAAGLRWISDDAFITFRYVKNFVEGHGIVYNQGEHVEGYTHFLWLLVLSGVRALGFDDVNASVWLGISAYAITLILYLLISKKEQQKSTASHAGIVIPLTAALLAANYDMNVWASGGLETSLYTLLISLSFFVWFYTSLQETRKLIVIGVLLLCISLTRPDGVLFTLCALLLLATRAFKQKQKSAAAFRSLVLIVLPSVIVGVPYLLWKYHYYGDIFPTPYYAKSASGSYFAQGFFYMYLFFRVYIVLAVSLIAFGGYYLVKVFDRGRHDSTRSGSPLVAAVTAVTIYLVLFVARVGGDFMFARFIIPILPLLYTIVERLLDAMPRNIIRYRLAIALVLIGGMLIERQQREQILFHIDAATNSLAGNWSDDGDGGPTHGIADERWVYTKKRFLVDGDYRGSLDVYCDIGRYYEPFFAGLPVKVAIMGGQNSIAYYADFAHCIDVYGLTDSAIAHSPIASRGRIGHEKVATDDYLKRSGTDLEFFAVTFDDPKSYSFNSGMIEIPQFHSWQSVKIINYDKEVMTELDRRFRAAGIRAFLPVYEKIMPNYLANMMPTMSADDVQENYDELKTLYFQKYPDPAAENAMLDYIARKRAEERTKR